ncbi:MAG: hypothetical protein IJX62_02820 [Clostridia bacterium]|nr:hypothetical protein [Clostridia bacterium]
MKWELHAHTAECDPHASVKAAEIVRMYREIGYGGIVITDHYFALSHDWFRGEVTEGDHRSFVNRWLRGYRAAREAGEQLGVSVLLGAEVRLDGSNINDYLVYGLTEDFFYNAPLLHRFSRPEELIAALPAEACVVQAHPFRNGMTVQSPPAGLFGMEVYNGGTDDFRNGMAKAFASHHGGAPTSGSDFHHSRHLGRGGICTKREISTTGELLEALRGGDYSLIEGTGA